MKIDLFGMLIGITAIIKIFAPLIIVALLLIHFKKMGVGANHLPIYPVDQHDMDPNHGNLDAINGLLHLQTKERKQT